MHIRLALRRLAATPTFTIGAIAVLALDTGATLAVFTVLNGLVLKTLPVPEPGATVARPPDLVLAPIDRIRVARAYRLHAMAIRTPEPAGVR